MLFAPYHIKITFNDQHAHADGATTKDIERDIINHEFEGGFAIFWYRDDNNIIREAYPAHIIHSVQTISRVPK